MRRILRFGTIALKILAPIVTVVLSVFAAQWLIATKPAPPQQDETEVLPAVHVACAQTGPVCFPVRSQGTVMPRTESTLIAQVAGRILKVADSFDESGFFKKNDVLVEIDPRDYDVRIRRLDASKEAAQVERDEAQQRLNRQLKLRERDVATQAELDQAQAAFDVATARIAELNAQLDEARYARDDTSVVAPFDGCIREKNADVGQYVTTGTPLATCFATDAVEVRLPINDDELAFLDLPLGTSFAPGEGAPVILRADFGGQRRRWQGSIVRSEAIVDRKSRMAYLVASVPSPYDAARQSGGHPLAVGMFVEATIRSSEVPDAIVLPAACVESGGRIFTIDSSDRLRAKEIQVLRRVGEWAVVRGDLTNDQRVCATHLERAVDGMRVQVLDGVARKIPRSGDGSILDLCGEFDEKSPTHRMTEAE
ncbi:MAG: efflux RND transporter periplasmic adaptor subunit [Planctomycetes bacterium]|nr:efflux RND transporter periplasmic adaptor subunit [Planctomycetota bacterium]MBL7044301.1 efflux RND transporter periplasmic adaptor subunit [Pirellulaceae bacterium]